MAFSKLNYWIGIVFMFSLFTLAITSTGTSLYGEANLTDDSLEYITQMGGFIEDDGVSDLATSSLDESKRVSYISSDNETSSVVGTDNVGVLFYFKKIGTAIENTIKISLNAPSTMLLGLGLPIARFKGFINILVLIMSLGVTVSLVRSILK